MASLSVYDAFGPPPATLPPSTYVRRWDTALAMGAVAGAATYTALGWVLWRDWPVLGARPELPFGAFLLSGLQWREWTALPVTHLARIVAMLAGGLVLGLRAFVAGLRPRNGIRHLSGPRLLEGREAESAARRQAAAERGNNTAGFLRLHPSLDLPKSRWTRHLLVVGSVGSGKTQIILPVVSQAFEQNLKAFVYDVKGDFSAKFPSAALVSPWDARSRVWDVGADVRTPAQAATFAAAFIPTDSENGGNRFFAIAAQQLLIGALRALQNERGKDWGWDDLAHRLRADRAAFADTLAQHYPKASPLIADETSSATSGVLATLAAYTRSIDDLALAWGNGDGRKSVSLRRWLRDDFAGRRQIVVQAGPDAVLTGAYIGAMVRLLESLIISPALPDDELGRSLLFVLDELPSLKVDVSALVDKGRSKGVCVIGGLQDLAQLREALGPNRAAALVSMVGTHVVCRLQLGESRDAIAGLFGRERVAVVAASSSGGAITTAMHEETRAVVDPSVLSSELGVRKAKRREWPHGFAIRALVSLGGDALMLDFPGAVLPDRQPAHVPARWTLPSGSQQRVLASTACVASPRAGLDPAAVAALAERYAHGASHAQEEKPAC